MNNEIIRARFMYQRKDKAVYEREIILDTPTLNQYYGRPTTYLEFDMPLLFDIEPAFIRRGYKRCVETYRATYVTRRPLRFIGSDGTILCELSERRIKAKVIIYKLTHRLNPTQNYKIKARPQNLASIYYACATTQMLIIFDSIALIAEFL